MFRCIKAKTPSALAGTKVKGHAKQHHIDDGVCTPAQAAGNAKADSTATLGYQLFNDNLADLATWFKLKHSEFHLLMRGIQNVIVDMMLANADLRHEKK